MLISRHVPDLIVTMFCHQTTVEKICEPCCSSLFSSAQEFQGAPRRNEAAKNGVKAFCLTCEIVVGVYF